MSKYDRGPEPASPIPWEQSDQGEKYREALIYHSGRDDSRTDGAVADVVTELYDYNADARAIVHRVNNWDAACDEIDRLRELVAGLPAMVRGLAMRKVGCPMHDAANAIEARIREVDAEKPPAWPGA